MCVQCTKGSDIKDKRPWNEQVSELLTDTVAAVEARSSDRSLKRGSGPGVLSGGLLIAYPVSE